MKKKTTPTESAWDIETETEATAVAAETPETPIQMPSLSQQRDARAEAREHQRLATLAAGFDLEGLMTDFPTATELQKFVFDQTGIALNLKGRANRLKYQVALDVLNGDTPAEEFLGTDNPYLDRNDVIPMDALPAAPAADAELARAGTEVNTFSTRLFPHPDPEFKAQDQNCHVMFRKYSSGVISYEILGPVAQRAVGERLNKYGRNVPERYTWVDPRTGERIIQRSDGSLTPLGTKLRAFMRRQRMNNSNQWDVWIDRDFVVSDNLIIDSPWSE
jgi:hypothetical protein